MPENEVQTTTGNDLPHEERRKVDTKGIDEL